jgi:L-threonylcarbamoyladenylate synthase
VGTSANIHGEPSPATAQQVIFDLGDRVDLLLDGGRTPLSRESTVVDLTQDPPRVVREGAIPRGQVEEALR